VSEPRSRPVDPRDARWELRSPSYRVHFCRRDRGGWRSREFEVLGEDAASVMRWADEQARAGETYTLYAVIEESDGFGLVPLFAEDPT